MSKVYQLGPRWKGFSTLRYLVIFGDSYSDLGFNYALDHPSPSQPLGIPFPGMTFNPPDPNWVGHLITKYCPEPRFDLSAGDDNQDPAYVESALLVYDFAIGGHTVDGVRLQVSNYFLPKLGTKPPWAPWNAEDTLFITWVGINDCGRFADPSSTLQKLFSSQEHLIKAGARNFLFIDVPPVYRCPAFTPTDESQAAKRYLDWNNSFYDAIEKFCATNEELSVFLFSSFWLFQQFLNHPSDFDIDPREVRKVGGDVWVDHLHPTSKVHDIIASGISSFLNQIAPDTPSS
ncbi:hypothetical protein GALMADRAFT_103353 [Galerina marginata CBS 339.88]|uniref:SGNH hydrolase-type esterase domain-containing protein n=1 Tax=Galerina marginata (strain CBS 339.88) TaxID=685588 RepID=A0A067SJJ6_GALM3|nr:hypothetical protein GALMADRAFT_103353 [Galerina marginata CBS 339.88]